MAALLNFTRSAPALICDQCGSTNVIETCHKVGYRDPETGYPNEIEATRCLDCGYVLEEN